MRACYKCGEKLVVNEDRGLMECTGGLHIEPINFKTPQWWATCKEKDGGCGMTGLVVKKQMPYWQKREGKKAIFDTSEPGFSRAVYESNPAQENTTCKGCGRSYQYDGQG